jgi:hypothetical protein
VVQATTAVEDDLGDTGLDRPATDRLTDLPWRQSMFAEPDFSELLAARGRVVDADSRVRPERSSMTCA